MTHVRSSAARDNFSETMNRVAYGGERLVLERRGKRLAALVPIEDLDLLERLEDEADYKAALRIEREARKRKEHPLGLEDVKRHLGLR